MYWPSPLRSRWSEGGQDGNGGVHAGHQVGEGHAGLLRAAAGQVVALAGDGHQAAHALDEEIVAGAVSVGAVLAETGHRAVDQVGLDGLQRCVVQPVARELTDLVVFQHHVGAGRQVAQQGLAFGAGDVDRDGALAAVGGQVVGRFAGVVPSRVLGVGRAPGARVVAHARAFDLDDVGAEVGQVLRAPWSGQHARQIQHADVAQCRGQGGGGYGHGRAPCCKSSSDYSRVAGTGRAFWRRRRAAAQPGERASEPDRHRFPARQGFSARSPRLGAKRGRSAPYAWYLCHHLLPAAWMSGSACASALACVCAPRRCDRYRSDIIINHWYDQMKVVGPDCNAGLANSR